jgi:phi LC3 family holin
MKINIPVRFKNKAFWIAMIPAVLLLIQLVADVFGYHLDFGDLANKLIRIVNAIFAILAILGIVTDPTTNGFKDSDRAMGYSKPWVDEED